MTAFELDTSIDNRRLVIDGHDLTAHARAVTLIVEPDEPAALHVEVADAASLVESDAIVHLYHPPTDEQVIEQARALLASLPVEQVRALAQSRFTSMSQDMVSLTIETIVEMLGGTDG